MPAAPAAPAAPADPNRTSRRIAYTLAVVALAVAPLNAVVFVTAFTALSSEFSLLAFFGLAALQTVLGVAATVAGVVHVLRLRRGEQPTRGGVVATVAGIVAGLGGAVGFMLGLAGLALASGGGAWGRPLRIRGRVRHPELRAGADWTRGPSPDGSALDPATRAALEALWLHDAQKEHASVPAFARVAWMLAAVGAPAELLRRTLRAADEEVDHAERCFALAVGYGGRSHSVEPMPELLLDGALEVRGDVHLHLALESLEDGCLLEDYNADVAAACAKGCSEPTTRALLEQIAREERSHAELSWAILRHCLDHGGEAVRRGVASRAEQLASRERPTAVSSALAPLVARADSASLRAHGRIPDADWASIYAARLRETSARVAALVAATPTRPGRDRDVAVDVAA